MRHNDLRVDEKKQRVFFRYLATHHYFLSCQNETEKRYTLNGIEGVPAIFMQTLKIQKNRSISIHSFARISNSGRKLVPSKEGIAYEFFC